jgi:hypothetical protein
MPHRNVIRVVLIATFALQICRLTAAEELQNENQPHCVNQNDMSEAVNLNINRAGSAVARSPTIYVVHGTNNGIIIYDKKGTHVQGVPRNISLSFIRIIFGSRANYTRATI